MKYDVRLCQTYTKEKQTQSFHVHFSTTGSCTHSSSALLFENWQSKAITEVLMSIYISASASSDVTRLPTECAQTQENTHLGPNPYFFLVENNYHSDRPVWPSHHTIIPAVPYLVWRLTLSVLCAGEASLCLLSHRVTTGDMMTCTPCSTESPNKRSPGTRAVPGLCNIRSAI